MTAPVLIAVLTHLTLLGFAILAAYRGGWIARFVTSRLALLWLLPSLTWVAGWLWLTNGSGLVLAQVALLSALISQCAHAIGKGAIGVGVDSSRPSARGDLELPEA